MKIVYTIYKLTDMDVHVPSKDYYRKAGDADQETIKVTAEDAGERPVGAA
jgi:hypothetical protein